MRELMEKKVEAALLYGYYGSLLTENQAEMLRLYCDEDYSLAEIARQFDISRQGVYDTLNRAVQQMAQMEEKLHLARGAEQRIMKLRQLQELLSACPPRTEDALKVLSRLLNEEESNGV